MVYAPRETLAGETRCALTPESVQRLVRLGLRLEFDAGLGAGAGIGDAELTAAGAAIAVEPARALGAADYVLRLHPPAAEALRAQKRGSAAIGFFDPFNRGELVNAAAEAGLRMIAMELIPRTTLAQKMDALSSQASIAGYVAVILAAERLPKVFPMMMTPAGTLAPARVFVIGAGVAGLQAIATARRLGARVEAYDTRPVVEEQVQSLGAKFVKFDLGETGQTKDGYAKALTEEQLRRQREAMARHCAGADVVIAAAQVFGRRAPVIVTDEMIRGMKPGSVVVDLAVETGGNVEGITPDREETRHGVRIVPFARLAARAARHASQMYASNLASLIEHFWDKKAKQPDWRAKDEILKGCQVTLDGAVVNPTVRERLAAGKGA